MTSNTQINDTYVSDADFNFRKLITDHLPVVTYTLQYIVPMKSIQVTYVSNNFHDVTGCNVDTFRKYHEFYKNVVVESHNFFDFLDDSQNGTNTFKREYRVRLQVGGCNVLLDYTHSKKISNDVILFNGIITNITFAEIYNVVLRISEERLRIALAASGAGFFDWEMGSSEIFCDSTAIHLFGLQVGSITLKKCLQVIDKSMLQHCLSIIRDIFCGRVESFCEDVLVRLPTSHWVCISGKVIEIDNITRCPKRIAGTVRDITDLKNILLERERINDILEKRVHERTERLESELATKVAAEKQLLENLERERELNTTKSVFVNMVSHEFRTPLAIIQSSVDLIQMYFHKLSREDIESSLISIKHAVQRMTKTMNDILILGKVQTSQMKFNPSMTDVLYLFSSIIEEVECTLGEKRIVFEISNPIPDKLFVDAGLIEYIISNLLSNALKYSDNDKNVILRVEYIDQNLVLHVDDQGIGISENDFERIFKLFQRGSNVSNRPGIGVGMFIIKYCINLHHGSIVFHSKEGDGTSFKVTLPAPKERT